MSVVRIEIDGEEYDAVLKGKLGADGVLEMSSIMLVKKRSAVAIPPLITINTKERVEVATEGGTSPAPFTLTIGNQGGVGSVLSTPTISRVGGTEAWLTISAVTGSGNNYSATFTPDVTGLAEGFHTQAFDVNVANATNTPFRAFYVLRVDPTISTPSMSCSPNPVSFTATEGGDDPAVQTVTVSNVAQGGDFAGVTAVEAGGGAAWLTVGTPQMVTSDSYTFTLTAVTGALADGVYTQDVTVSDANVTDGTSPTTLPVTFTVGAALPASNIPGAADLPQNAAGTPMAWDPVTKTFSGSPVSFTYTSVPTVTGTTYDVASAGDWASLPATLNDGDCIRITGNFSFSSSLTFPARNTSGGWVVVRSDGFASLPTLSANYNTATVANRVHPTTHAAALRTITCAVNGGPGFRFPAGADGYWIQGINFTGSQATSLGTVAMIDWVRIGGQTLESHMPTRLVVDRCVFQGPKMRRALALSGGECVVMGCYMDAIHAGTTADSQSIYAGLVGGKHMLFFNNRLADSTELTMSGGTAMTIPDYDIHDIAYIRNWCYKSPTYRSLALAKNMHELKHAVRVLYFGNLNEGYRPVNQFYSWTMTPTNQNGPGGTVGPTTWAKITDVTMMYNKDIDTTGGVMSVHAHGSTSSPNMGLNRLTFWNNVQDCTGTFSASQILLACSPTAGTNRDVDDVTIVHNTLSPASSFFLIDNSLISRAGQWERFVAKDNAFLRNISFGPIHSGTAGQDAPALNAGLGSGNWDVSHNVMSQSGTSSTWDATLLASPYLNKHAAQASIFTNYATGDFTILAGSIYKLSASDGLDPGAEIATVNTLTANLK